MDTRRQRMGQTALRSAMGSLTRLGIVVETISKFARELARFHPVLHALIVETYAEADGPAHDMTLGGWWQGLALQRCGDPVHPAHSGGLQAACAADRAMSHH